MNDFIQDNIVRIICHNVDVSISFYSEKSKHLDLLFYRKRIYCIEKQEEEINMELNWSYSYVIQKELVYYE